MPAKKAGAGGAAQHRSSTGQASEPLPVLTGKAWREAPKAKELPQTPRQDLSATMPLPTVQPLAPEALAAVATPPKACIAFSPGSASTGSNPDRHPVRRTLAVGRLSPQANAKMQVHLSSLYFKPFFSHFADVILKNGINISPYPCVVSKMAPDYHLFFREPGILRVLYFVAQALPLAFFQRLPTTQVTQIINHFPRMELICDKVSLAFLLSELQKVAPSEYTFTPRTFISWEEFQAANTPSDSLWVVKEDRACCGAGIRVTFDVNEPCFAAGIVQEYVHPPMLYAGKRFDIRVYVLVVSFEPLRVLIADEGMCHLCVEKYTKPTRDNVGAPTMHVTNMAVNMKSEGFGNGGKDGRSGHVRSFADFDAHFPGDAAKFWEEVRTIIMQTLAAVKPFVDTAQDPAGFPQNVKCMEMLGFDFLCTDSPQPSPVLMEANQFPAWQIHGSWYAAVKVRLMRHLVALADAIGKSGGRRRSAGLSVSDAMAKAEDAASASVPNPIFMRMWPPSDKSKWGRYSSVSVGRVEATLTRARDIFSPYVSQFNVEKTAALPLRAACTPATPAADEGDLAAVPVSPDATDTVAAPLALARTPTPPSPSEATAAPVRPQPEPLTEQAAAAQADE